MGNRGPDGPDYTTMLEIPGKLVVLSVFDVVVFITWENEVLTVRHNEIPELLEQIVTRRASKGGLETDDQSKDES